VHHCYPSVGGKLTVWSCPFQQPCLIWCMGILPKQQNLRCLEPKSSPINKTNISALQKKWVRKSCTPLWIMNILKFWNRGCLHRI
jgi:hypothetical protein